MTRTLPALVCAAVLLVGCGAVARPVPTQDREAFSRLGALAGEWHYASSSGVTSAQYALVSRGSALLETWTGPSGAQTLTVYHPDHATVMLTHYCAQGNQAVLRLTEASATSFRFERESATNVTADQAVLTTLELTLEGDALVRVETYVDASGTAEVTTMRFVRAPTADPAATRP